MSESIRSYSSIPVYEGESIISSNQPIYENYVGTSKGRGNSSTSLKTKSPKEKTTDIGEIRSQVMQELYDELYGEIKDEVRKELQKEKQQIVSEIKEEVKTKLKADLIRGLTQDRGEYR